MLSSPKEETTIRVKQKIKTRGRSKQNAKGVETEKRQITRTPGFVTPSEYLEEISPRGRKKM